MVPNKKFPKGSELFCCESCDYSTSRRSQYIRHIITGKHQILTNPNVLYSKKCVNYECICGKSYKHSSSLSAHKKTCNQQNNTTDASNNEFVFDFDTKSDLKTLKIPILRNDEYVVNQTMVNKELKQKAKLIRDNIDTAVDNFNRSNIAEMIVKKIDMGDGSGRVMYSINDKFVNDTDYNKLLVRLEYLAGDLFKTLTFLEDGRSKLKTYIKQHYPFLASSIVDTTENEVLTGGSHRSSHLAKHKHKHKNKNKTKHKYNHNHKARPNRKNKKTIKKYRAISRMPSVSSAPKQNVVSYNKHKKTTIKSKHTRNAKINKNKTKSSNKKSRKFRR